MDPSIPIISRILVTIAILLFAIAIRTNSAYLNENDNESQLDKSISRGEISSSATPVVTVIFNPDRYKVKIDQQFVVNFTISFNKSGLDAKLGDQTSSKILISFRPVTQSPQFNILNIINETVIIAKDYNSFNASLTLETNYIGHASLEIESTLITDGNQNVTLSTGGGGIHITAIREEGLMDKIFFSSVIIFITISYINLGAQIDTENVKRLRETPEIILFGFLIGATVMPAASFVAGHIFFQEQPMYRIGSFIYAIGPAASASVLWTVMFDADKELALGLQIASTIGALVTMPFLLFAIDKSIDLERRYTIKVPYTNLARQLIVLLIALLIGSRLVGRNKRAKQISQRIFRPLTLFVLLFIIVFSSIVYWYIYKMFDWHITKMAVVVTLATYVISGLLGYLINRDIDHMITMSINSTYRNSGVAFAALVVAFEAPDTFIAYVPCLTQVVTTSLIGLVLYSIRNLKNFCSKKESSIV